MTCIKPLGCPSSRLDHVPSCLLPGAEEIQNIHIKYKNMRVKHKKYISPHEELAKDTVSVNVKTKV